MTPFLPLPRRTRTGFNPATPISPGARKGVPFGFGSPLSSRANSHWQRRLPKSRALPSCSQWSQPGIPCPTRDQAAPRTLSRIPSRCWQYATMRNRLLACGFPDGPNMRWIPFGQPEGYGQPGETHGRIDLVPEHGFSRCQVAPDHQLDRMAQQLAPKFRVSLCALHHSFPEAFCERHLLLLSFLVLRPQLLSSFDVLCWRLFAHGKQDNQHFPRPCRNKADSPVQSSSGFQPPQRRHPSRSRNCLLHRSVKSEESVSEDVVPLFCRCTGEPQLCHDGIPRDTNVRYNAIAIEINLYIYQFLFIWMVRYVFGRRRHRARVPGLLSRYAFLNAELFAGPYPPVLVTLQRHSKAEGYSCRIASPGGSSGSPRTRWLRILMCSRGRTNEPIPVQLRARDDLYLAANTRQGAPPGRT